jgi:lipopolysaccharide cholinephosphotransferase
MESEFFKAEERSGFFVDEKMKKVWAKDLELLEVLENICEKHNIKWYADGGTLLGAVRHKGFIPWDDDIDIQMLRPDYDRFLEACKEEVKEPYFLQWAGTEKNFQPWHAKLRDDRTTGSTRFETNCFPEWHRGIFIDIFPLDNVPDGKIARAFFFARLKTFRLLLLGFEVPRSPEARKISKVFAKVVLGVLNKFTTHEKLSMKYLKLVKSVPDTTKKVGVTAFRPGVEKYEWDRTLFDETIELPFENRTLPSPKNYDERLSVQYGDDYMTFKKGQAQHTTIFFDTDKSWREYR